MLDTEHAVDVCSLRAVLFVFIRFVMFLLLLTTRTKLRYQFEYLKLFQFLLPIVTVLNINCGLIHNNNDVSHLFYIPISICVNIYLLCIRNKYASICVGKSFYYSRLSCRNFSISFQLNL